jgi:predicted  nucleic acid-binding Zn-ribbon protein
MTNICKRCGEVFEVDPELLSKVPDPTAQKFCSTPCAKAHFKQLYAEQDETMRKWRAERRQAFIEAGEPVPDNLKEESPHRFR